MNVDLVILNYNGRGLLGQCLPSIIEAASVSRHDCRVVVVDNASTDGSVEFLRECYPHVVVEVCPNQGLCSYNVVLERLDCDVAVLLNNDIRLDAKAVDPLIEPFLQRGLAVGGHCYMTAPQCRSWTSGEYEGQKTAVAWRWGLIQATALYSGHKPHTNRPGMTASAGAAMAVDRQVFLRLGGFDPLYLPGRLEDLDLAYRAFLQGYLAEYVPQAVAFHAGQATFAREFGTAGCERLALRNTLLFQWKNLHCPRHRVRQLAGYTLRLLRDVVTAPFVERPHRWRFIRAWKEARLRWQTAEHASKDTSAVSPLRLKRERTFFHQFHPKRIDTLPLPVTVRGDQDTVLLSREELADEPVAYETV